MLQALVSTLGRFLAWLTTESGAVPGDMVDQFLGVHGIVATRLAQTGDQITAITDSDDPLWQRLQHAGLNGEALHLKVAIWQRLAAAAAAPPPPPRGRGARVLGRLMNYVNGLLSGLATVFPAVELAKAYQDGVEAVADYNRAKDPPAAVVTL